METILDASLFCATFGTMKKIALISDTHGPILTDVIPYLEMADEIWHAGDIGTEEVIDELENLNKHLRIVWGNIDNHLIRARTSEYLNFEIEGVKVLMTHIGGYPPKYNRKSIPLIEEYIPDLFICGHSHICKVIPDQKKNLLHINPGACGVKGFHKYRTIVTFIIDQGKLSDLKVIELGLRSSLDLILKKSL